MRLLLLFNNTHNYVLAVWLLWLCLLLSMADGFSSMHPKRRTNNNNIIPAETRLFTASKDAAPVSVFHLHDIQLNPMVASVNASKTVEVFGRVKQMQGEGKNVTSLCVGEPDFDPPNVILDAIKQAVTHGQTRYTAVTGTLELRYAISDDLERRKGVSYDPNSEIVVGNGAKQAIYQAVLALCGTGDQVIVPAPYWPSYPEMVALANAETVYIESKADNGYLITPEQLRSTLESNPKVKMLILCNPSNPTGGVYNRKALKELGKVLEDYPKVAILSDEIYERLVYPPDDMSQSKDDWCPCFACVPGMWNRTLTVNGFSKSFAMTGLRLGYVAAPANFARAVAALQSQITSCAGSVSQAAGVAALKNIPDSVLEDNVKIMREKRDYVLSELEKMPHVKLPPPPRGAFYVLPDLSSAYNGDDEQLCLDLLEDQKLALVPGSSFGAPGCVRISYATSMEELQIGMSKLNTFLSGL